MSVGASGHGRKQGDVMRSCVVQSRALNCVYTRSVGLYDAVEMRRMIKAIMELDMFRSGAPTLCDERGLIFNAENATIVAVGQTPVDPPTETEVRSLAMVAESDLGFGMMRMLAAMREQPGHRPRVFRTMAEAADWLGVTVPGEAFPDEIEALMAPHLEPGAEEDGSENLVLLTDNVRV